jgi:hypothetical protein
LPIAAALAEQELLNDMSRIKRLLPHISAEGRLALHEKLQEVEAIARAHVLISPLKRTFTAEKKAARARVQRGSDGNPGVVTPLCAHRNGAALLAPTQSALKTAAAVAAAVRSAAPAASAPPPAAAAACAAGSSFFDSISGPSPPPLCKIPSDFVAIPNARKAWHRPEDSYKRNFNRSDVFLFMICCLN